jgi:hypothetical protein
MCVLLMSHVLPSLYCDVEGVSPVDAWLADASGEEDVDALQVLNISLCEGSKARTGVKTTHTMNIILEAVIAECT